jgi:hypothetical protein
MRGFGFSNCADRAGPARDAEPARDEAASAVHPPAPVEWSGQGGSCESGGGGGGGGGGRALRASHVAFAGTCPPGPATHWQDSDAS